LYGRFFLKIIKARKIIKLYALFFIFVFFISFAFKAFFYSVPEGNKGSTIIKETEKTESSGFMWISTVLITAVITAFMTYNVQSKLAKNKLRLDRLEKRASFIQSIAKDLNDLVNDRIYFVKIYIDGLESKGVSQGTRDGYIKSASTWNIKIHSVYSSLNMHDIVELSNDIERNIHYEFVKVHNMFLGYVGDGAVIKGGLSENAVNELRGSVEIIVNNCSHLSKKISDISDDSWNRTLEKMDPLTIDNLPKSSNLVLIKRILNLKGSPLGVNRSIYKH